MITEKFYWRVCVWYPDGSLMMARDCDNETAARNLAGVYASEGKHVEVSHDGDTQYKSDEEDTAATWWAHTQRDRLRDLADNGRGVPALIARCVLAGICRATALAPGRATGITRMRKQLAEQAA